MVKDSLFKETRRKDMGKDNAQALVTRTGGGVRLEILRGVVNPEVSQNQKENSSGSTMTKKVT